MNTTKKKKKWLYWVVFLCVIVYVVFQIYDMQSTLTSKQQELEVLQIQYETQQVANKELERKLESRDNQEQLERAAREKLRYASPEEQVFMDMSGS